MKRIIFAAIIAANQIFFPDSLVLPGIIILIHILQPSIRLFKIISNGKV